MYASARRFFARLASEIFLSSLKSEIFNPDCGAAYARLALAKAAALVPASRPNTAPFIKPDPPG